MTSLQESANFIPNGLKSIWSEVLTVWDYGFMGVDIGKIIIALLVFAGFLVLRGILSKYILHTLHRWTARSETMVDDKIVDALIPPIRFIPIILGIFFAAQILNLEGTLENITGNLVRSLIAFTIFWSLHRALDPIKHLSKKLKKVLNSAMVTWIFKVLKVMVVFIGASVILEIWGIAIGPLLAGLGLFGAAIALGAQDLFKNLIGGLTIIAEKRFHANDWIKVDGIVEGTVEEIGFRSTRIRRFDKAPVYVPNTDLADAVVTNFSRMTNRRIHWAIGVTYSTSKEQLILIRDEIADYIEKCDDFEKAPEIATLVRIDSFNASSIDFLVNCFTKSIVWADWMEAKERLAFAIKDIVENKAKAEFAFPSQSIYVESLPTGDLPEIFKPPQK